MTEKQKQDIDNQLASIKASKNESSALKASVKRIHSTAEKYSKRIAKIFDDSKKKIDAELASIKTAHNKELGATKSQAKTDRDEVGAIRKQAKSEYNRFATTYRAATNKRDGVQAKYDKIVKLHSESQTLHGNISKNNTSAKKLAEKIGELHSSSKKNEKSISTIHERAEVVRQQIEETYGITIDTMLSGTLKNRKDELLPRVRTWEWVYIGSLIMISVAIVLALTVNRPPGFMEVLTERFVFLTPLLLIVFVASRQFAHERRLLEEYAFKAAAAQALKGYTILLAEQFKDSPNAEAQIIEFTVGAMKNIYDRAPLEQKSGLLYQLSFGNSLGKIEAKIQEIVREEIGKATTNNVANTEVKVSQS